MLKKANLRGDVALPAVPTEQNQIVAFTIEGPGRLLQRRGPLADFPAPNLLN